MIVKIYSFEKKIFLNSWQQSAKSKSYLPDTAQDGGQVQIQLQSLGQGSSSICQHTDLNIIIVMDGQTDLYRGQKKI